MVVRVNVESVVLSLKWGPATGSTDVGRVLEQTSYVSKQDKRSKSKLKTNGLPNGKGASEKLSEVYS